MVLALGWESARHLCVLPPSSSSSLPSLPFPFRSHFSSLNPPLFPGSPAMPPQAYFELYAGFRRIDASDDRRIEIKEWRKGVAMLAKWGVRLSAEGGDPKVDKLRPKGGVRRQSAEAIVHIDPNPVGGHHSHARRHTMEA